MVLSADIYPQIDMGALMLQKASCIMYIWGQFRETNDSLVLATL